MAKVAVDLMGGDYAPEAIIAGAELAVDLKNTRLLLIGTKEALQKAKSLENQVTLVEAEEVVGMHEAPGQAVKRKKKSSLAICVQLIKQKQADAMVSAGNTGAIMAYALLGLGRLPGVNRPAIATIMPSFKGPVVLLDAGANVDCKPMHLYDFAYMGGVYAKAVLEKHHPRIGLLSIGAEASKGNEQTLATLPLLANSGLNFIGNVEGRDITSGKVDVTVCDGFVGNVLLKFGEGIAELCINTLKEEINQMLEKDGNAGSRLGEIFRKLANSVDYSEYGGAPLLGVEGTCIICHGSSSPKAINNAIRLAVKAEEQGVNKIIARTLERKHTKEIKSRVTATAL